MFRSLVRLMQRPYRAVRTGSGAYMEAAVFGVFVCLFLWLFQPFGLGAFAGRLFPIALGFGAVCTLIMAALGGLLPRCIPHIFAEDRWTVGRQVAWTMANVGLIGLANVCYAQCIGMVRLSWTALLWFEGYTLLMAIFPVSAVVLWNEARLSRRYRSEAEAFSPVRTPMPVAGTEAPLLTIPSENGREDLVMPGHELLFIRSAANYLEVFRRENGVSGRKVIRGSLKRVEHELAEWPRLLRCHKSHLVNLDRVDRVSGNAQGYRLHIGAEEVPVSRQLNARIRALLVSPP